MSSLKVQVTQHDHVRGDRNALVTLVEYGDYECPHCGHAHPIVNELIERFSDQLCFAYRHFPLTQMHPYAQSAAETAEFAGKHKKFWQMHDLLYDNQENLGPELYEELAQNLDLPVQELDEGLESGVFLSKVKSDFSGGVRSGVNGTPSFFINGERYDGAVEDLADALQEELQRAA